MRKLRVAVVGLVAVAMLSLGITACTPEEQTQLGTGIGQVIGLIIYLAALQALCPPCPEGSQCHDCGP